jgi:hypothetical protein
MFWRRGAPEGSLERQEYDKLRASVAGGNFAAPYAKWLTGLLDWSERFFGDKGTEGQRGIWLKKPAPLWTAPALDRCLLLASTIFVVWAISGHVGPAEAALGLNPAFPGWWRVLAAVAIGFSSFVFWRGVRARGGKSPVWITVGVTFAFVFAFTGIAGAGAGAVALAVAFAFAGLSAGAVAVALFVFAGAGASAVAAAGAGAVAGAGAFFAFAGAGAVAVAVALFAFAGAGASAVAAAGAGAVAGAGAFFAFAGAGAVAPLVLFLGLLTLFNAPFDWASLGLTRALLRRGLELGGWWPYLLALVDAALASVIIACLALVMVIGVQAFDELAVYGGGNPVLPLNTLFDGIARNPGAPEYWWVYALLLSTMIPSLVNLAFGGMAVTRGIPGLPHLLLRFMPDGNAVPGFDRAWMALVLTAQIFAGVVLGISAQALLAWGLIFHGLPALGLDLLDMARAAAAFDLPSYFRWLSATT